MRKIFITFPFLWISVIGASQNNLPPAFEINADTAEYENLNDSNWEILEDKTGKLTFEQVSQLPLAGEFHAGKSPAKGINAFWFRYRIKNIMAHEVGITIPQGVQYTDIYTQNSTGKWDHKVNGYAVPWSRRGGLKRITQIDYTIQPGEELLVYERDKVKQSRDFPVSIGFTDKVIRENYVDDESTYISKGILVTFQFAFLLLAVIFNLFFFGIVRERVYLFYSLFLFFIGLGRFYAADAVWNIFFSEHPVLFADLIMVWPLFFFFYINFVRYFLESGKWLPWWDKFLFYISIFQLLITSILWQLKQNFLPVSNGEIIGLVYTAAMLFVLITFILFAGKHRKSEGSRLVAVLPAVCLWSLIYASGDIFELLGKYYGVRTPGLINWFSHHQLPLEFICLVWMVIFFSRILFQRYLQLQKRITQQALEKEIERNQLIAEQKIQLEKTVAERTSELKNSLNDLKNTQAQLIQSEKMASLGELTAGIAHEIQNPLNFVNNFSEVNSELIEELKSQKSKVKSERVEKAEDELLNDIAKNLEKISNHGKRADAIVKGMLQHSRTSSGQKELTDINALCDEYLRLAYHGLRAKDKTFNAEIQTNFDISIGKINIVPQDIGRVTLNLINNAFYEVNEKEKLQSALGGYKPQVVVSTRKLNDKVEISVKDNGSGIPRSIKEKIFQPFFTTKPTGQGTGLGLSLSYDIIKAYGGEIKVESKEGEGAEFTIQLSLNQTH